jgi:hypothetical protein
VTSRRVKAAAAVVVAAIVLVVVARLEAHHQTETQERGMRSVMRLVGPLGGPALSGYRLLGAFDCLTYRRGRNPFALELCVDPSGRVVEAIDRRTETRHVWSLRFAPSRSDVRVDAAQVQRLLKRMGA